MKYVVVIHPQPGKPLYQQGALDLSLGKEVCVTDDWQRSKRGILLAYEVRRDGREMYVELDVPGNLLTDPPLDGGAAYAAASNHTHGQRAILNRGTTRTGVHGSS